MGEYEKIDVRIPVEDIGKIDFLVNSNDFPSRSEVVRVAIRDIVYERVARYFKK